jgi:hypothetical protein
MLAQCVHKPIAQWINLGFRKDSSNSGQDAAAEEPEDVRVRHQNHQQEGLHLDVAGRWSVCACVRVYGSYRFVFCLFILIKLLTDF